MIEHTPVLLNKVLGFFDYLKNEDEKVIGDFTLGFGGHSKAFLEKFNCVKLIGIDRDAETLDIAKKRLKNFSNRVSFYNVKFSDFDKVVNFKLDGVLLDLGVNLMQLTSNERGFSFNSNAMLDMRMDKNQDLTAYHVVNYYPPHELERVFKEYAEIKNPKRIVKKIIEERKKRKIETCKQLNDIFNSILKKRGRTNPSTIFFQAIRIEVNRELEEINLFFYKIWDFLNTGSRVAVITFHSLEDRIVKKAFKRDGVKILTKKVVKPDYSEIKNNPRARSAKLRVCEWLGL